MKPIHTIGELVRHIRSDYSNPKALSYQVEGGWEHINTETFMEQVKYLTLGLKSLGVKEGTMVGILADSSPRWTIADLSIIIAGGVVVPLFANISNENFEFEVQQTGVRHLFVSGREQWKMYSAHKNLFDQAISFYNGGVDDKALTFEDVLEQGRSLDAKEPDLYEELLDACRGDALATIVYTSGSTGTPKGAMLTQANLIGLAHVDPFHWDKDNDLYLTLLPLAHIFARALNYLMLANGVALSYIRDIKTVGEACKEIHPTIMILVPRILEKVYAKMLAKVDSSGFLKKVIAQWAFNLANNEEDDSIYKKLMHPIADKVVYGALRDALGGNLRVVISGGAPLNPHLYHFFLDIGVPLYEGWGLTEAATVTCNRIEKIKIGTIGLPFDGLEVKIGEGGEILVKGNIVMQGYYKNEEATKAAFTEDGWLRTGDKGHIDEDGYVTIEGRIKELYKTSTGEYIAPVPIEQRLAKVPLIDMAMVVAEHRKFASCLLFPDFDVLHSLKEQQGAQRLSDEEFLQSDFIKSEMDKLFTELNKHVNYWEEIRAYRLSHQPTIEGGELTPTMKIRRGAVQKKYKDLIDEIYAEEAE